jgi:superoxide oxidase
MEPPLGLAAISAKYSKLMSSFHWLTAAPVIVAYVISEGGPDIRKDPPTAHILLGLAVLTLTIPRHMWRLFLGVPRPLPAVSKRMIRLASAGHATLYLLLFAVPLTGWITLSRVGLKIRLWGIDLPFLVRPADGDPGPIADMHQIGGNLLLGIAVLHATFALWHLFRLRDRTLQRMWPFQW